MSKVLVIAEHKANRLSDETLRCIAAASQLELPVELLVAGSDLSDVQQQAAAIDGISKLLVSDAPWYQDQLPEELAALIAPIASNYRYVLLAATSFGKDLLPRIAGILGVPQISDITQVISQNTFERPIYAGNAFATVQTSAPLTLVSVRASAFSAVGTGADSAPVEQLPPAEAVGLSSLVKDELSVSERPELGAARVVVSGGRGFGSAENFKQIEQLADKLDAAIGASRAAVDAGYVANELQVGQTGKIVAPELYIALGISGAIQHLAGMKDSKVIVAVNKDPDAPIFEIADYALVADLFDVLPELIEKLPERS